MTDYQELREYIKTTGLEGEMPLPARAQITLAMALEPAIQRLMSEHEIRSAIDVVERSMKAAVQQALTSQRQSQKND